MEGILRNHETVLLSFGISSADEDLDLPKPYCIPTLHKDPYKQRYIAGSAKCSTKALSQILTIILMAVRDGLQKYSDSSYSRSGMNQMCIQKFLKNFWKF